jgi:glycosyltransferase involved in cell wall biosynthesis
VFYRRLAGQLPTGIDRVSLAYVRHYAESARAVLGLWNFFSVLNPAESARAYAALLAPQEEGAGALPALIGRAYLRWWAPPGLGKSVLLNTSHTGLEHPRYAASLRRRGARPVFLIHDLIPITHPQYCRPGEDERHARRIKTAVTLGGGIIVPSQHTLQMLEAFCAGKALRPPPTKVAPLASGLPSLEPAAPPILEPYFVALGTIEARKNLELLLDVWQELAGLANRGTPRLVVIGQRGLRHEATKARMAAPPLRDFVIELNGCNDRDMTRWLRHARALLFPSFEEGYGLPLAEALALGTPAIVSDLPAFKEIAGDVAEYAGPRDAGRWSELIVEYARPDSERRAGQLRRLAGFRAPTWEGHFEQVDAFLARLD